MMLAQAPPPPPLPFASPMPSPPPMDWYARGSGSFLGIGVKEIDSQRAKDLKLPEERGVEVSTVAADSPAAKAGLKEHDVVSSITANVSKASSSSCVWSTKRLRDTRRSC